MRCGVVVFPGSNCDQDALLAAARAFGEEAVYLWHGDQSVSGVDAVIVPGGFAYGDYLRCGAIAKFSPVMQAVKEFAAAGGPVLGICNGFQVLTEVGLLPGALLRNRELKFVCRTVPVELVTSDSPFTNAARKGQVLQLPVAHGEGCYYADERTLDELEAEDRVAFRYVGDVNGSMRRIAGVMNRERNVLGLMPHPERATEALTGSTDGLVVFKSLLAARKPELVTA